MSLHDRIMELPLCASYAGRDLEAVELRNHASEIGAEGDARIAELEQSLKRQTNAAKMGMDAARKSGAAMYEQGKKMVAENSPEAIESERAANAILTDRVDQLEQCLKKARKIALRSVSSVPDEAIDLIRDALEGTPLDDMGNRDDDGLIFAAQMDWLQEPHHKAVVKLADALKLIQEKAK